MKSKEIILAPYAILMLFVLIYQQYREAFERDKVRAGLYSLPTTDKGKNQNQESVKLYNEWSLLFKALLFSAALVFFGMIFSVFSFIFLFPALIVSHKFRGQIAGEWGSIMSFIGLGRE